MSIWIVSGSFRAARGGSWGSVPQDTRVADRNGGGPGTRYSNLGLRLARRVS